MFNFKDVKIQQKLHTTKKFSKKILHPLVSRLSEKRNVIFYFLYITLMGKWKITDLEKEALQKFWKYKSLEYSTSIEDARIIVRNQILTGLFTSNKLQEKIKGMMFRNQIHSSTYIDSDILQNTFMELSKSNKDEMFIALS